MKIISLQAENIKKLVAVEIRPDGHVVQITGKNGQGKTSVLDAIWWALAGSGNVQTSPIRNGEMEARIRLDMGEIVVTRSFTRRGEDDFTTRLSVLNADGTPFMSPQSMLDGLMGSLTFDPLAFSRMDRATQFKTLAQFVPDVDFAAIDRDNKKDYDERTDVNRRAKEARVLADKILVPADGPEEMIDDAALIDRMESASKLNADITLRKNNRDKMAADAMEYRRNAKALIEKAVELESKLANAQPLPTPVDISDLRKQIAEAQEINADVTARAKKKLHIAETNSLMRKAEEITQRMEARETMRRDKIASANLPIAGLGFGDGCVLLNGIPLDQASDAEQLRASIAIAMAMHPKLRVIRVRDGSLLDEDALKLLEQMAQDNDYQVWIERVDSSGKVGFVLEDGKLVSKSKNETPSAQPTVKKDTKESDDAAYI